jgi:hypothetical protein
MALAVLHDISVSGAFLQTTTPFGLHCQIEVEFFPFRARHEAAQATVIRVVREGLGVEWTELAPLSVRHLLRELAQGDLASHAGEETSARVPRPERAR